MRSHVISDVLLALSLLALGDAGIEGRNGVSEGESHRDESSSCFGAFSQCSKSVKCSAAFDQLDMKCKVIAGRCGAPMVDLTRCAQIMDHIFSYGFPDARCNCPPESEDCRTMLEKIYSNPCFGSIRHLRKFNLFPKEIHAYDQAEEHEPTTTTISESTSKTTEPEDESEHQIDPFEGVFDDKKQGVEASTGVVLSSTGSSKAPRSASVKPRRARNKLREGVTNPPSGAQRIVVLQIDATDNAKRLSPAKEHRPEVVTQTRKSLKMRSWESPEKERTAVNDADYKSIAIILGVLLGLFLLSSVFLFSWARAKGSSFYTNGKLVRNRRVDEGIHSKSELNFSTNSFICSSGNPSLTNGMV